jgi:hypothetical protein
MRRLAAVATVVLIAVGMTGCDHRECVKSHQQSGIIIVNKVPIVTSTTVCDRYAPEVK